MKTITLPRLRLNQSQILCETSLRVCANIPVLQVPLAQTQSLFDTYKNSMNKISVASECKDFDTSRDLAVMGLHLHARAQSYYPYNSPEVNAALLALNTILDVFDTKIRRLPMDESTWAFCRAGH